MTCPACYHDNLPGDEQCRVCGHSLTFLDELTGCNRVERSLLQDTVSVLRPRPPVTIVESASLEQAVHGMLDHDIGALLVLDAEGQLVGIISERDLLIKDADGEKANGRIVRELMTPRPETVTQDDTLAFALHKMDVGGYRHLPVMHGTEAVGVISVRDMLRHITQLCIER
jgi:CBS domain-containing protein